MSWTDERVATLKKLWADGLSAAQVATQLGGVSRNAVIGKVTRLGLQRGTRPIAARAPRQPKSVPGAYDPKSVRNRRINAQLRVAPSPPPPPAKPVLRLVETATAPSLVALGANACKWPIGHPGEEGFGFCGRDADGTYCNDHARVAFKPKPPADKTIKPRGKLPLWALQ